MKGSITEKGVLVDLRYDGATESQTRGVHKLIHNLMAESFLEKPEGKPYV
jgi:hypothetical protein